MAEQVLKNDTLITLVALVPNVTYTDMSDPDIPERLYWKRTNDTEQMTFEQAKRMFGEKPNYKNWLMPTSKEAAQVLGLSEEHYQKIKKKYKHNRVAFETTAVYSVKGGI